ncbi:MAG: cytochrome c [Armatimonadota bacterium]|nr:cytochrome c [Armatimonadota bacterium]MDR7445116.1 cytochrome c [Armatimonadota bacterium]MDR7570609.1 cytochrome c [Armatimonadota bacterium]MDR7614016.1 cytochrome c [Armatimonadota bacterium]
MAEHAPTPEHPTRRERLPVPLLLLYALLPAWAVLYLFVVGGLVAPEVRPVARTVPGVSGIAAGPVEDGSEQVQGILAVVPQEARAARMPPVSPAALQAAGQQYATLCAVCHGPEGRGDGPAGATLNPKPMNFHARAFQERMPPGATFWVIKHGLADTPRRSGMPAFGALRDEQIWALVAYVRQLGAQQAR